MAVNKGPALLDGDLPVSNLCLGGGGQLMGEGGPGVASGDLERRMPR